MKLLNDRVRHDLPLTEAEWAAWRQWMGLVPSSSSSARRRKRKKRRKRRLPRRVRIRRCGRGRALFLSGSVSVCSLVYCRSGRAGRRQWQWYVLGWFFWCCSSRCVPFWLSAAPCGPDSAESCAVLGPVVLARRCATTGAGFSPDCAALPVEASTGAVLGRGYGHCDRCRGPVAQFRSCSSSMVVDIPVFAQLLIPMVLIVQKTIEIPQLLVDTVADVPFVLVVQVLTCRLWVGQSSSHSSCSLRKSLCLLRSLTSLSLRRGRSPRSSLFGGP